MERTNARDLDAPDVGGAADLTVVDASFIGLGKLAAAIARCTREGGELVALVKPQFEVGREQASRGRGVVRDEALRAEAITAAAESIRAAGFELLGQTDSTLPGPKGNVEAFVHARRIA
jgi:23S rRNA (cytidine1920-2'-O)/16S rRNA (cytidine1409-2'-O)-methyltransferase